MGFLLLNQFWFLPVSLDATVLTVNSSNQSRKMLLCRWLLAELTLYKAAQSAASASFKSCYMSHGFLGSLIAEKKLFESSNDPCLTADMSLPNSKKEKIYCPNEIKTVNPLILNVSDIMNIAGNGCMSP